MSAAAEVLSPPTHPSLALGAYAADLVAGARVALFGDATLALTSELVERGARLVHVFDIDAVRAAEAEARGTRRSVVFGTLPPPAGPSPAEASFDLVLIPDLSFTEDPEALIRLASGLLAPKGAALIASPNPEALGGEALGYYELYDAVAKSFRRVRMIGQAPFSGYVLAEFSAADAPAASVDTSLAGRPEPAYFVALASQHEVRLQPFAIIELPSEPSPAERFEPFATIPAPPPRPELQALEAAKVEAEARAQMAIAERNRALADRETARVQLRQLEQSLAHERKRAGDAHAALLVRVTELTEREAEVERLDRQLQELEGAQTRLEETVAEYEAEFLASEARLRERGQAVEALRREASSRGRLVRELVSQMVEELEEGEPRSRFAIEEAEEPQAAAEAEQAAEVVEAEPALEAVPMEPTPAPSLRPESAAVPTAVAEAPTSEPPAEASPEKDALSELQDKLDRLAQQAAHREADLIAAQWKIAELEHKLAEAGQGR